MKIRIRLIAILSAAAALLSGCGGTDANSSVQSYPAENNTSAVVSEKSDEAAIIEKLGVDYRANWKPYIMEFNTDSCDYWFIKEGDVYHAFYLEFENQDSITVQNIAHATSTDFLNWKYEGTVLRGYEDGWDNRNMATGSVAKLGDIYYMLYTGHSTRNGGIGLAKSSDLYTWERVGDAPVISSGKRWVGMYEGKEHPCTVLADPYIYPEAIDGYFYAYINSWAIDMPKNSRGCQLMFRTKDFVDWEPYKIAVIADDLDRLETCQVWEHGGKWYMSFGGRTIDPNGDDFSDVTSGNYIYMADNFDGPYLKQDWSVIEYVGASAGYYIQKQIVDPFGDEVMLPMSPYRGVLWPFYIKYGKNGEVSFDVVFG